MDRLKSTTIDELVENLHVAALSGAEATLGKEAVAALAAHIGALEAEKTKWLQDFRIQQDAIIAKDEELAELREKLRKLEDQEPIGYLLDWPSPTGKRDPIFCKSRKTGELNGLKDEHIHALYANPIPSAPAVPEWRPIETAPKEKMVLLAAEFACEGDWRLKVGYFNVEDGSWKVFGASWEPTHWMPLPAAPQPKESSHG